MTVTTKLICENLDVEIIDFPGLMNNRHVRMQLILTSAPEVQ